MTEIRLHEILATIDRELLLLAADDTPSRTKDDLVKSLGVHQGQGYFFAAPMTAKAISAKIKAETPKAQLVA